MIADLIATKICHDLAGLIGAVRNVSELMISEPTVVTETGELLNETTRTLSARLAYLRALFGTENKAVSESILQRYLETLTYPVTLVGRIETRWLFAVAAFCAETLIKGGRIEVSPQRIQVTGETISMSPQAEAVLRSAQPAKTASTILCDWMMILCISARKRLLFEKTANGFSLCIYPV